MIFNFIHWNADPYFTNLFGLNLRYYSIFFVMGFLSIALSLYYSIKREGISSSYFDKIMIYGFLGSFVGSRLGHCLFYEPEYFIINPMEMFFSIKNIDGNYQFVGYHGLSSHGGLIGLVVGLVLFSIKTKFALLKVLDLVSISVILSGVFNRIGNFYNSEIIGTPSSLPWAVVFDKVDHIPRHPVQIYESIIYLIIFGVMVFLFLKQRDKLENGMLFSFWLIFVFSSRFLVEFFKEKQVNLEDNLILNLGQLFSLPFIVLGILLLFYIVGKNKTYFKTKNSFSID